MLAVSRDGGDDPVRRVTPADSVVLQVGDEKVPMLVERGPVRRGDHGTEGGAAVAGVPFDAASGDGVDDAGCGVYPADASVMGVGHEQVALAITRDSHGVRGEGRFGRGAAVAKFARSASRDGGDDACGQVDPADAAVVYVGEVYGVVSEHGRSISLGCWGRMV